MSSAPGPRRMAGRYQIDAPIGEGAMAQVYSGHDPSIGRKVALKLLKPELRKDVEVVERFLAESRAAGMLSHANIVTIYDVGQSEGTPYIAMEFIDGTPLDEVLEKQGRLSVERVLAIGAQIADALAFAHQQGVVHRDIKPSNILISDDGKTAKLLDFGIARIDERDACGTEQRAKRTQAGQVMGTPRYMSPEQAIGLPVDARTDLFSLGAVLYEMLSGKPAFAGNGLATLAIQIAQEKPADITSYVPDCPKGLAFIIAKLLAKKPDERFADARALHTALLREIESKQVQPPSPRRGLPLRFKLPLAMSASAALALAIGAGTIIDRQKQTLDQIALSNGSSMAEFVARNAALRVAENAGLPPAEQDWLPLQAFVETAARDRNVHGLIVVDRSGTIRAAGDPRRVGTRLKGQGGARASRKGNVFSFARPIEYAGANFGYVEMSLGTGVVDAANRSSQLLLAALAAFVTAFVAAIGYLAAVRFSQPLHALRKAMIDVADGRDAFQLSHTRKDEIGELFDALNAVVRRTQTLSRPAAPPAGLDRTRVGHASVAPLARQAA